MADLNARVIGPHADVVAPRTARIKIYQCDRVDKPVPQRLITTAQRAPSVQERPPLLLHLDQSGPIRIKRHRRERLPAPAVFGNRRQHRDGRGAGCAQHVDPGDEIVKVRLDAGHVDVAGHTKIATQLPHGQQQIVSAAQQIGRFSQRLAQDDLGGLDDGGPRPHRRLRDAQLRLLVEILAYRPRAE